MVAGGFPPQDDDHLPGQELSIGAANRRAAKSALKTSQVSNFLRSFVQIYVAFAK